MKYKWKLPMMELESGAVVNLDRIDCLLGEKKVFGGKEEINMIVIGELKFPASEKDLERVKAYYDLRGVLGVKEEETATRDKFIGIAKEIERNENTFAKMDFTLNGSLPIGQRCPRDADIKVGSNGCADFCKFSKGIHWRNEEEDRTYVRCTWDSSEKDNNK